MQVEPVGLHTVLRCLCDSSQDQAVTHCWVSSVCSASRWKGFWRILEQLPVPREALRESWRGTPNQGVVTDKIAASTFFSLLPVLPWFSLGFCCAGACTSLALGRFRFWPAHAKNQMESESHNTVAGASSSVVSLPLPAQQIWVPWQCPCYDALIFPHYDALIFLQFPHLRPIYVIPALLSPPRSQVCSPFLEDSPIPTDKTPKSMWSPCGVHVGAARAAGGILL